MAYHYILFMLAVIAGIYLWPEEEMQVDVAGKAKIQQPKLGVETMDNHSANRAVQTVSPHSVEVLTTPSKTLLVNSQGRDLVAALERFWRDCRHLDDCSRQLSNLELQLPDFRYQLLLRYLELNKDWQQIWGGTELNRFILLADKVEEFKQIAVMVWGDFADVIFADEFAFYDFSLELQSLSHAPLEDFVDNYQTLLDKWHPQAELLALVSNSAKYEKGISSIPSSYSLEQVHEIKIQLAKKYLTDESFTAIKAREKQVTQQKNSVEQYQTKLLALQISLESQSMMTELSDSEWQIYAEQQISQFRKDYFRYR
ncbi:chromosome segregation ATPase [Vibrio hepatarius]|uniref:chromosome segregation ATPase n=1 Tax=Vibrio hepatarius TaxID=171383 RepID=UPI001C09C59B|nr:chromosome segregation ATPase [Vibrio hepatarius]MBU2895854.1 chromosome segregation ATPase [Vibrio hepatarius]